MNASTTAAVEAFLHECAGPLCKGLLQVSYEPSLVTGIGGCYVARLPLYAVLPVEIQALAVEHAKDTRSFLEAVVDSVVKPFGERAERAAAAAITAWQAVIEA